MAVHLPKNLSEILKIREMSPRDFSFAWLVAAQESSQLAEMHPNHAEFKQALAEQLAKNSTFINNIFKSKSQSTIPDFHFEWIDDSFRQGLWIYSKITEIQNLTHIGNYEFLKITSPLSFTTNPTPVFNLTIPIHLIMKNRIIATIDYHMSIINCPLSIKIDIINWIQNQWALHTRSDAYFKWLDAEDAEEKREFFRNWLIKKDSFFYRTTSPFKSHEDLLHYFDAPFHLDETKKYLNRYGKIAWNQNQRRENDKDRKQYNFVLRNTIIKKLKTLSDKHKLSRNEIIEILIESEAKHTTYIKERLAYLNNMKSLPE